MVFVLSSAFGAQRGVSEQVRGKVRLTLGQRATSMFKSSLTAMTDGYGGMCLAGWTGCGSR